MEKNIFFFSYDAFGPLLIYVWLYTYGFQKKQLVSGEIRKCLR